MPRCLAFTSARDRRYNPPHQCRNMASKGRYCGIHSGKTKEELIPSIRALTYVDYLIKKQELGITESKWEPIKEK